MTNKKKKQLSGLSAEELFERGLGITYDDFTILNTIFTDIDKEQISLETKLGDIVLKTPIIASPMDTVTNAALCIAIALQGGIGGIHYNFKKPNGEFDIEAQRKEIEDVKRYQNKFIDNPVVVDPNWTIAEAIRKGEENKVRGSPIDTFPVTGGGVPHGKLLGLLRKQDYSRTEHTHLKVRDRMLAMEDGLIAGQWPMTINKANQELWDNHLLFLPVVNKQGNLEKLVTRRDIDKNEEFPLATKDKKGRLRVLFAVGTKPEIDYERLEAGFAAGADGCIIDTSQGNTKYEVAMLRYIFKKYPGKFVIGGNISTKEAYGVLNREKLKAFRNGQGSGSICTTAGALGISRAGAAGVYDCARERGRMKSIADGGLRQVGDIFKGLTIGAYAVMLGNMLAGTEESPGETRIDPESGLPMKVYRGMGSKEANVGGIRGYSRLPQGVSGYVEYRGSVHQWMPLIRDGLISAFQAVNCKNIQELHEKMYEGVIRFERRTSGSLAESRVHDLKY